MTSQFNIDNLRNELLPQIEVLLKEVRESVDTQIYHNPDAVKKIEKMQHLLEESQHAIKQIEYNNRHQMQFNYDPSPKSTTSPEGTNNQ